MRRYAVLTISEEWHERTTVFSTCVWTSGGNRDRAGAGSAAVRSRNGEVDGARYGGHSVGPGTCRNPYRLRADRHWDGALIPADLRGVPAETLSGGGSRVDEDGKFRC